MTLIIPGMRAVNLPTTEPQRRERREAVLFFHDPRGGLKGGGAATAAFGGLKALLPLLQTSWPRTFSVHPSTMPLKIDPNGL